MIFADLPDTIPFLEFCDSILISGLPFSSQDILFGLLKRIFEEKELPDRKKPLKVVVMSATLDTDKLSSFFNHCLVVDIPGRNYPVKEIFCGFVSPRDADSSSYITEVSCFFV